MRHRFPATTVIGLAVVFLTIAAGAVGSDVAGAAAFLGLFLFATGVWHGVRGTSWLTPLLPQGRRVGAGGIVVGLVVMVMAGVATPATGTESVHTPPSASASSPSSMPSDLTDVVAKPGTRDCVILSGTLLDPYTGSAISFLRGQETSTEIQIDHVVALSDAWQKGAQQLDAAARRGFANDPLNLLAVQGRANQQKGDGDAATWLPPVKSLRCQYVARQVAVKFTYDLWMTEAEHDASARILSDCPDERLPSDAVAPQSTGETAQDEITAASAPEPSPAATTAAPSTDLPPVPTTPIPETPETAVYYKNCTAAREAGAAPIHRGEPGYRSGLDGDNDGVACE